MYFNVEDSAILGTFIELKQDQPFTHILQLFRKPLSNIQQLETKSVYDLPIGKFYDVFSSELFCGTLFEFSPRYKIKLEYNNFSVYSKYKEYSGVRACSKNERWSCFVDSTNSALLVVSNMCFNLDIRK